MGAFSSEKGHPTLSGQIRKRALLKQFHDTQKLKICWRVKSVEAYQYQILKKLPIPYSLLLLRQFHQDTLGALLRNACGRGALDVVPIGLQIPCLAVVGKENAQNFL